MLYAEQLLQFKAQLQSFDSKPQGIDEKKIIFLKSLEQEVKDGALSKLYTKTSSEALIELADVFGILADIRIKLGNITHDLKYYTDAAIRLKYVTSIIDHNKLVSNESFVEIATEMKLQVREKLNAIHHHISGQELTDPEDYLFIHKDILLDMRGKVAEVLSEMKFSDIYSDNQEESRATIAKLRDLYSDITHSMKDYLCLLFNDAEAIIGSPPCAYSVIGLGSMALQQITPYSDLEFAILTENDEYQQSTDLKVKDYFKNLTHYVHFKVILLGESTIPTIDYGLNLYHLIKKAIRFDAGDKTPLVGFHHDVHYRLIQTIDNMLRYVRNDDNKIEHIDQHLPYILEKICFIHGSSDIYGIYQAVVDEFLMSETDNGQKQCEFRAIKRLSLDTIELDYTKPQDLRTETVAHGNLEQFAFDGFKSFGQAFDVKQEVYRLVDRSIYNLGLICDISNREGGALDILDQLEFNEHITSKAAFHLRQATTFANMLRLTTYSHYSFQKDWMDFSGNSSDNQKMLQEHYLLKAEDLLEDGSLYKFYYTTLPLMNVLKIICESFDNRDKVLSREIFYQADSTNKGQVSLRLLKYEKALEYLEDSLSTDDTEYGASSYSVTISLNKIGTIYYILGRHEEALRYLNKSLSILRDRYGASHPEIALNLNKIGEVYDALGCFQDAINNYELSLKIRKEIFGLKDASVAASLSNIGVFYRAQGRYEEALKYHEESLSIRQDIYGTKHPDVATTYNNIGAIYKVLNQEEKALQYWQNSLSIRQDIYGVRHPEVAELLNNIGFAYRDSGMYEESLKVLENSLSISEAVYGVRHLKNAGTLTNIGSVYDALGHKQKALQYFEKSLFIWKEVYGSNHPATARGLNNIGSIYHALNNIEKALIYYEESVSIYKEVHSSNHPDIAMVLNNIGAAYCVVGKDEESLQSLNEALFIWREVYDGKGHPNLAAVLSNIGAIYKKLDMFKEALQCYKEALLIDEVFFPVNHPNVQSSLANVNTLESAVKYAEHKDLSNKTTNSDESTDEIAYAHIVEEYNSIDLSGET